MNRLTTSIVVFAAFAGASTHLRADDRATADANWPAWRGPLGNGVAPKAKPPTEWSEEKNIKWKVKIPGRGHATPIVWGDCVYVQTAIETPKSPKAEKSKSDGDPKKSADHQFDGAALQAAQPGGNGQPGDRPPRRPGGGRRPGGRGRGGFRGMFGGDEPRHLFDFQVLALDRKTGRTLWTTTVCEKKPHESGHTDASQASNSPVTDGEHIYAYFGSRGLYCLDMNGKVQWDAQFGEMQTRMGFGEGSSPALYGDALVITWDHEGDDFIVALNKKTGKELWRTPRDESTSWCTPVVVEANGKPQVVTCASNFIRAYDLKTGKEIWKCSGMTQNTIPTPLVAGDLLYAISGFRGAAALAIRYAAAKGDITDQDAIVWKYDRDTPYVPTGVAYHDRLYFVENNRPVLTCLDAKTGTPVYDRQRLSGIESIYASFLAANGHVYIVGRDGSTVVLRDGPNFKIVATNQLDDGFDASPVAVGSELFLRGREHLYCISEG